ncbi:MAG: ATP-dependent Clp protease ATP-binding subunit ClpX [Bacteroidia bacterium]|nr:ATP-dependent Clp protease ATP-binding subunit ClpX [Bacteroidia bacterium]
MKTKEAHCSFCGKPREEALMLISGIEAHICDNCVEQAEKIIESELGTAGKSKESADKSESIKLLKPEEIKKSLDEYVIGQDQAKKVLSVAVYNHYKRLNHRAGVNDVELEKSNILMVGETGTGKTLLVKTLARTLKVPFCIADATVLTEAGYVGEDVESVISRLLQAAEYDVAAAERGIVYIDEIDKIARKGDNPSISRDVSGEGVQQGLLKLLEGTIANIAPEGGRKHPDQKYVKVDTSNILFICGGAFDGIAQIISRRVQSNGVGFKTEKQNKMNDSDIISNVAPADLKSYGLIPEIIGRMPVLTYLSPLDKDALRNILLKPKNALIKQYVKLFEMEGIKLKFDDLVIEKIVDKAFEFRLGARGLRSICESIMLDYMYEMPSKKIKELNITLDSVILKLDNIENKAA